MRYWFPTLFFSVSYGHRGSNSNDNIGYCEIPYIYAYNILQFYLTLGSEIFRVMINFFVILDMEYKNMHKYIVK